MSKKPFPDFPIGWATFLGAVAIVVAAVIAVIIPNFNNPGSSNPIVVNITLIPPTANPLLASPQANPTFSPIPPTAIETLAPTVLPTATVTSAPKLLPTSTKRPSTQIKPTAATTSTPRIPPSGNINSCAAPADKARLWIKNGYSGIMWFTVGAPDVGFQKDFDIPVDGQYHYIDLPPSAEYTYSASIPGVGKASERLPAYSAGQCYYLTFAP